MFNIKVILDLLVSIGLVVLGIADLCSGNIGFGIVSLLIGLICCVLTFLLESGSNE